jgi:RNA polymerase sigma-70 factor (ECF subfamily)
MPGCPPELNAFLSGPVAQGRRVPASAAEEEVVALFDELRVPLLRYLSGFPLALPDSEDVIQEAFLALFQSLRQGKFHHNVRGWLFRAAHNLALKRKRSQSRNGPNAPASRGTEDSAIDPGPNPEDQFAFQQTQKRLASVIAALPEQYRYCLYLRAEGLRYREIAEVLDISLGSVSLYLERSLAHIARVSER